MNGVRFSLLLCLAVTLAMTTGTQAQSIDLDTTFVQWDGLDDQGDGLFGWNDATASNDGFINSDGDHFDDAMGLRIDGTAYGADISQAVVNGLNVMLPAQSISGLVVQVEFQATNASPIMRQVIRLTNPTGSSINTSVQWINNTGNDSSQVTVGTSSGDLIETIADRWIVTSDSSDVNEAGTEANLWIIQGPGAPTVTANTINMTESESNFGGSGDEGLETFMNVEVPAGQTRYVMYFVGATTTGQEALDLAVGFDDTDSALFQSLIADMSNDQVTQLVNWLNISSWNYQTIARTRNQIFVGQVFDLVFNSTATGEALTVKTILDGLTEDQRVQVMQQAIPQINMATLGATLGSQQLISHMLDGRILTRLNSMSKTDNYFDLTTTLAATDSISTGDALESMNQTPSRGVNLWAQSINSFGDQDSDTNAAGYSWQTYGGAVGLDRQLNDHWLFGMALTGYNASVEGANQSGDADTTAFNLAAYAGWKNGPTHVQGGLALGFAENQTTQIYPLLGLTAEGEYDSSILSSWLNMGHVISFDKCPVKLEPVAGIEFLHIRDEAYTQTGGGIMNQTISEQNTNSLVVKLGANLHYDLQLANEQLQLAVGTSWRHQLLDDNVDTQSSLAGNSFNTTGVDRGRNAWEVSSDVTWQFSDNMKLNCNYTGQFASNWDNHMVKVGLLIAF
ncbi:MAG TPA: hypothetical protein DCM28_13340 [Phycisphaerales bacterium]|nr:hypothetical protein [Phycisphaerales bacterium]